MRLVKMRCKGKWNRHAWKGNKCRRCGKMRVVKDFEGEATTLSDRAKREPEMQINLKSFLDSGRDISGE